MYENAPSNTADEQLILWLKIFMICSGLWKGPITSHRWGKKLHFVYSIFMTGSYFTFVLFLTLEFFRLLIQGYDTHILIASLGVMVSANKIMVKTVVFIRYQLQDIFNKIVRKEREVWASDCQEIQALYRSKVKFARGIVLALFLPSCCSVILLQVWGGVSTLKLKRYNIINNASLESHFMYQTFLPLNRINHINWLFLTQFLWGWVGMTYSSVTHLIYLTILVYGAAQLQILQIRFRKLMENQAELFPARADVQEGVREFREHLMTYTDIITFINHFNQGTKYLTMMDFFFYSLDIASVSLNIAREGGLKSGWFIFYFITLFVQLILIAWTCNEIKVQSEALGHALFHSKWYLLDMQTKKNVLFVLMRIGKPLQITIGVFGPMTTNAIAIVLKAAYSYVNLMMK